MLGVTWQNSMTSNVSCVFSVFHHRVHQEMSNETNTDKITQCGLLWLTYFFFFFLNSFSTYLYSSESVSCSTLGRWFSGYRLHQQELIQTLLTRSFTLSWRWPNQSLPYLSIRLASNTYQFCKSFDSAWIRTHDLTCRKPAIITNSALNDWQAKSIC